MYATCAALCSGRWGCGGGVAVTACLCACLSGCFNGAGGVIETVVVQDGGGLMVGWERRGELGVKREEERDSSTLSLSLTLSVTVWRFHT